MNEIEKRMNATVDIVTWLDQRIAQQVEHQLEQRLAQEREQWRCVLVDLIVEERERVNALLAKEVGDLVRTSHDTMIARVEQLLERIEATLADPTDRSGADAPPSKH